MRRTRVALAGGLLCALVLGACGDVTAPTTLVSSGPDASSGSVLATASPPESTPGAAATPRPRSAAPAAACRPTDQDRYVYNPDRLLVKARCLHVSGVIDAVRQEADGDLHILLRLDSAYRRYLTPANQGEELGDLVVEPVCVHPVTQADAIAACAADPDPLQDLPHTGMRVWMEGRHVLDTDHGDWAELHPLYRWGTSTTTASSGPSPAPTPIPVVGSIGGALQVTQIADGSGDVSWTWSIRSNTGAGTASARVACSLGSRSGSATTTFAMR